MSGSEEQYYGNLRPEVARLLPPTQGLRVLEIGCGSGGFRGNVVGDAEYWGIEPVASAASIAMHRMHKVLVGTFESVSADLPRNHFDLVICNDVIEHMPDHNWFLREIQQFMAPGAVLLASIPNVRYIENLAQLIFARDWKYVESGVLDRTHLRFFTRKSLLRVLEQAGWQVQVFQGLNPVRLNRNLRAWPRLLGLMVLSRILGADSRWVQFGVRMIPPQALGKSED